MMIILAILFILGIFGLVYLKGKTLQTVFDSATKTLKEKKKRIDSINDLAGRDISAIEIYDNQTLHIQICDAREIEVFKELLKKTKVCKLNRKNSSDGPKIEIDASGDKHIYELHLSSSYQEDLFIKLMDKYNNYFLQIPGLKRWLDKNISNRED